MMTLNLERHRAAETKGWDQSRGCHEDATSHETHGMIFKALQIVFFDSVYLIQRTINHWQILNSYQKTDPVTRKKIKNRHEQC